MISNFSFLASLKVSLVRDITDWPDATQGEDTITMSIGDADVVGWDEGYIAKVPVAGGAAVSIDLADFTTLLFEENVALNKVHGVVLRADAADETQTDFTLKFTPGAVDGLQWFFTAVGEGVELEPGALLVYMAPTGAGATVDGTHSVLSFENTGTDDAVAVIIVLGGRP